MNGMWGVLGDRWFMLVYATAGILLLGGGIYLLARRDRIETYLLECARLEQPPAMWVRILRSIAWIGVLSLGWAVVTTHWIDLLFSIWSLVLIFIVGRMLTYWPALRSRLLDGSGMVDRRIGLAAFQMIALGVVMFLLLVASR
jgi:hypothetical protein